MDEEKIRTPPSADHSDGSGADAEVSNEEINMPMDFPDMQSLIEHAKMTKFRPPNPQETEQSYRTALANYIQPIDLVESMEIRNKVGWDKFTETQNLDMLVRGFLDKKDKIL